MSRNVGTLTTNQRCVTPRKSEYLIYIAAKTESHASTSLPSYSRDILSIFFVGRGQNSPACSLLNKIVKVKWSRYRPGVAQRVGKSLALFFHHRGIRRGWVVSSTARPHFTLGKDPVPILQEAGWAPGPVWPGGKSRNHRDSIPDHPARSQSLYRLSYPAQIYIYIYIYYNIS